MAEKKEREELKEVTSVRAGMGTGRGGRVTDDLSGTFHTCILKVCYVHILLG